MAKVFMKETSCFFKSYHTSYHFKWIIKRSCPTNFFSYGCWKHKDIGGWIIMAQILFILIIQQDRDSTPMIIRHMHCCLNTQFLSWEACFNKYFKRKAWFPSGHFHSKADWANSLMEILDLLSSTACIKMIIWISQREEEYLTVKNFDLNFHS